MHGTGGGQRFLKDNVNFRRPVMRVVIAAECCAARSSALDIHARYAQPVRKALDFNPVVLEVFADGA